MGHSFRNMPEEMLGQNVEFCIFALWKFRLVAPLKRKTCPGNCAPHKEQWYSFCSNWWISYVCNFEIRFESLYGRTKRMQCTRDSFPRELCILFVLPYKDLNNRRFQKHTLEIHRLLQEYHGLCGAHNSWGVFSSSKSQHIFQSANMKNSRIFSSMHLLRHIPKAVSAKN